MHERRKFVRIPKHLQVSYKVLHSKETKMFFTANISESGMRFFVRENIPKDTLLEIKLNLDDICFSFEAVVKVMWSKKETYSDRYEVGVEFVNIPKEAQAHLNNFINSYFRKIEAEGNIKERSPNPEVHS